MLAACTGLLSPDPQMDRLLGDLLVLFLKEIQRLAQQAGAPSRMHADPSGDPGFYSRNAGRWADYLGNVGFYPMNAGRWPADLGNVAWGVSDDTVRHLETPRIRFHLHA
jgi:hypothetical protein